ncbi:MAG: hypothetical protein ACK5DV_03870 [Planctomycetota bacterium]
MRLIWSCKRFSQPFRQQLQQLKLSIMQWPTFLSLASCDQGGKYRVKYPRRLLQSQILN